MELQGLQSVMRQDGRVHDRQTKETIRTLAVERIREGQDVASVMALSAVNAKVAFSFSFVTYEGGLTGKLSLRLLKHLMYRRKKPLHLLVDGLPAHKKAVVKDYVAGTEGRLTLHLLPGCAPDLNPDELVWSHAKRTGVAGKPLMKGAKLQERVRQQLQ